MITAGKGTESVRKKKIQTLLRFIDQENAQAMVEYAVVAGGIVAGVLTINAIILPPLNNFYRLISLMLSLPIP